MIDFKKYTHAALFAGGLLFGTAGLKLLSSKDAKNVYAHTTAAALRVKDCVIMRQRGPNALSVFPFWRFSL